MEFPTFIANSLLMSLVVVSVQGLLEEPRCSKYDFEERVLEKLVVLDHTVKTSLKDMDLRIKKIETETENKLLKYETERQEFQNEMENFKTEIQKSYKDMKTTIEGDIDMFKRNTKSALERQSKGQAMFYTMAEERQTNLTSEINDAIKEAQELMKNETIELRAAVLHEPIAFIARTPSTNNPSAGDSVVFQTPVINFGNAYNPANGIFTVPVAGVYLFSVQICINAGKIFNYQIRSEENVYSTTEYGDETFDDVCSSVTTVAVLKKSEQIWVKCTNRDPVSGVSVLEGDRDNLYWTMFTGILIHSND